MTALILLAIYLAGSIVVHQYSLKALFRPQPATYQDDKTIIKIPLPNGLVISARYFPNPHAKHTLLFSHGNRADIGVSIALMEAFQRHGYAVMIYDYPGYGTSTGKVGEKNTYAAIHAAYDYLVKNLSIPADQILLYGRSLGGAPSIELARHKTVAGIIVEGTFTSVYRIKFPVPFLLFDKFKNINKIAHLQAPILIIHGEKDEVISISHGHQLFKQASVPKDFFWVPNAIHATVIETAQDAFWEKLAAFSESL